MERATTAKRAIAANDEQVPLVRPAGGWTEHIEDVRAGRWTDPRSGKAVPPAPFERIVIDDSLDGAEGELVDSIGFHGKVAIVGDTATWDALGARVAHRIGRGRQVVLDAPHVDLAEIAHLTERLHGVDHVIAVGSGSINDLCKYVTANDGRGYCVFATAASMDGYTSSTASVTLESGLKTSLPAHAAKGVFIDLEVNAAAPARLAASGFGDSICRPVCQVDWWLSHRLFDTMYTDAPYAMCAEDEATVFANPHTLPAGDLVGVGYLQRLLTLSGCGVAFTGVSNHGSMGEHQISHYIDCFARDRHPGTLHGEQVGVATLTMARIQHWFLAQDTPPRVSPTRIDGDDMRRRMGAQIGAQCEAEYRKKALDEDGAAALNDKLEELWPTLREELRAFTMPIAQMQRLLADAGGATTAMDLGVPLDFYREAVRHGHEMRNRFSFADIACDAGMLDDFALAEI